MNIVLADVEVPRLDEAAENVKGRGVEVLAVPTDVSDAEAVEDCVTPPSSASVE